MITKQKKFKHRIALSFLLILTASSVLLVFPLIPSNSVNNINDEVDNDKEGFILPVLSNGIGEDAWWNVSYQWRQCINITNPRDYNLTENFISIEFDYTVLRDNYDMDSDLYDVRIVENNIVRNYYVKKDFPSTGFATIWFETNSTLNESEYDTYMYWGNASINHRGLNHVNYDPSGTSWWSFEEGSGGYGSNVIDSLDYANATLWGSSSSYSPDYDTDSAVGSYSLNFDSSHDFVYINDEMHFTNPNEIPAVTVSCWFKTFYSGGSYSSNWAFFDFDRSEYFNFYLDPTDGKVGFSSSATGYSGQNDFYGTTTGLNDGQWHFASVVYDGSDKIIYVDGVEDNRWVNAMNGLAFGTTTDRWGFFGDGSEASSVNGGRNNIYYSGNIDEIRYFDYAVAPDEIQWLANYYPIETDLLPITERAASVTIIVKDVDGRRVPGAKVSLWDNLTHILEVGSTTYTDYTSSEGIISFTGVPFAFYNITVNYTTYSGSYEELVYDSRDEPAGEVEFKGLFVSANVTADLWTIDFEVKDWDGDPLNYGYVDIGNSTIDVLDTISLDSAGEATYRWINSTSYNYTVYYDNPDYYTHPTSLNSSTIYRTGIKNYSVFVQTNISKLEIRVMDETGNEAVTGVTVKVQLNNTATDVVYLETDTMGYAYGDHTNDFSFWYKTEQVYNFSLWVIGQQQWFKVNTSDKWKPTLTDYYNYTLDRTSALVFFLDGLNFIKRIANFTDCGGDTEVIWGENMSFWVLYETSNNSGEDWVADWNAYAGNYPTSATWTLYTKFGEKILEKTMVHGNTTGNFTISINSNFLTAGSDSEFYFALVSGYKPFWNDPYDQYFGITVIPKSTGLTLHNYTSMYELPKNIGFEYEISEYYGNNVNIAARFYDDATNGTLVPDIFTYDWDYGSGSLVPHPSPGYYYFGIDTTLATNVGKYRIDITVSRENYSIIENFGMYINIISRPTTVNGSSGLLYISENIFIFEENIFTFDYVDVFSSNPIYNLDEKSFLLQKIDENGDPIPGTSEIGELVETVGNKFVLDLDTETRLDGEYSIIVTLDKLNYEHRIAIISLTIKKREFQVDLPTDHFKGTKIEVESGASLHFTLTLSDPNNGSVPVIGANVSITFKGTTYNFEDNEDGTYTLVDFPKIADAFFLPETFTVTLKVEKQYFSTNSTTITIVVNMHETFGFPTFYLLMIIGAIVAVTASLAIYRTVQQARIPTFVKKAKKMKKNIKGKKIISESLLYPSKEEYMVKRLGDRWEMLGLSLQKVLGIEGKKKKTLPEPTGEFKDLKGGIE